MPNKSKKTKQMETIKAQNKSKFLQVCIGVSMILISASLFIFSINHASASSPEKFPALKDFIQQGGGKIGKYACSMCAISGGKNANGQFISPTFEIIILDTETGKTICYTGDADNWKWVKDINQIPANPFQ
jgi:hypothetical protein